jgi:hypothetical protein
VGITAVLACLAALAVVPSAFAHHGRISGSMNCDGVVSYTASAWQTTSTLARTHYDVRVYVVQANGTTVSPAQQVGSGQFKSSNGFAFSGSFTVPALVTSVKLNVKEIGSWANGVSSSGGTNPESFALITRPTSGCTPPPTDVCPNLEGLQETVPAGKIKDANGNCVTPPPPPTDECPNIEGLQTSVPTGMVKDGNGNCGTPPPPPTDECPNIAGVQTSVPAGMLKDSSGNCSTPPPPPNDECPNLEGAQTSVPEGMIRDASGNCGTPPVQPPSEDATPASLPGTVKPAAIAKPKAKVTVKKKAKKKVVKKKAAKKKKAVKKQPTAKKTKPSALPFTR